MGNPSFPKPIKPIVSTIYPVLLATLRFQDSGAGGAALQKRNALVMCARGAIGVGTAFGREPETPAVPFGGAPHTDLRRLGPDRDGSVYLKYELERSARRTRALSDGDGISAAASANGRSARRHRLQSGIVLPAIAESSTRVILPGPAADPRLWNRVRLLSENRARFIIA